MPAKSKAQQRAAGAALSAKRGETKVGDLQGASKQMYDSMTEDELEDAMDELDSIKDALSCASLPALSPGRIIR